MGGILEAEGYEVALTATVPEALAQIERRQFAVALIDLRFEGEDGLAVLPALKNRWPGAVGIVMTGHGSQEAAVQAMRAGADDFLLKPAEVEAPCGHRAHHRHHPRSTGPPRVWLKDCLPYSECLPLNTARPLSPSTSGIMHPGNRAHQRQVRISGPRMIGRGAVR